MFLFLGETREWHRPTLYTSRLACAMAHRTTTLSHRTNICILCVVGGTRRVDVQSQWLPLTVSADCTHFPLLPTRPIHYFTRNSRLCRRSAFTLFFLSVSPLLRNATHVILFYHCFFLLLLFFYRSPSLSDDDDRDDCVRTHSGWLGKVVVGTALETAFRTYFNENVLCERRRGGCCDEDDYGGGEPTPRYWASLPPPLPSPP